VAEHAASCQNSAERWNDATALGDAHERGHHTLRDVAEIVQRVSRAGDAARRTLAKFGLAGEVLLVDRGPLTIHVEALVIGSVDA
jgi:hypothetical protein